MNMFHEDMNYMHLIHEAVKSANDCIVITDPRGDIIYVNETFTRLMGFELEDVIGMNPRLWKSDAHDRDFYADMWKTIFNGKVWEGYMVNLTKDKRRVHVQLKISPIHDNMGELEGFVSVQSDVTHLMNSNAKLESFAYVVAHDLKSPLAACQSYIDLMKDQYGKDIEPVKLYLDEMEDQLSHMSTMIRDVLDYSKLETIQMGEKEICFNALVDQLLKEMAPVIASFNGTVERTTELPTLKADPIYIKEVFKNLIGNGLVYNATDAPMITVSFDNDHFCVQDNGIGIRSEDHENVFGLFKRLNPRHQYKGGSGAGLAIVKKIIEFHNGRIWIDSELGKGACFCFTLGTSQYA